ncbi:esterase/lipase family protein, partial [Chroococcidiopsis sp.]|uniref:esterase/lipase family protein n=1 Tax=Chroococcidiopsis sp. TaxID=3088168 RepID=UPI003F3171C4
MSIKYWLPLVAFLCLQTPALAERYGSAPFDPSPEDDEHFMVDKAPGNLDTGCTYRDGSPLRFKVKINRYVGPTEDNGTLKNIGQLIERGVISEYAELKMPNYDVDSSARINPETDLVYFNGTPIGKLTGVNNAWETNSFKIPTRLIKFPARRGSNGADNSEVSAPDPAENEIRIDIDTTEGGWCAAIDWAQIQFKAMAPLLLIHGTGANPKAAWEELPGVTNYLTGLGIPFEHKIQLGPNARIFEGKNRQGEIENGNAEALVQHIRNNAASFGVQKVHLVAHSKGGLDSRGYLSRYLPPDVDRVLSLHTLSTPHQGSILANLSVAQREKAVLATFVTDNEDVRNFLDGDLLFTGITAITGFGPQRPALDDLRVEAMTAFNRSNTFPSRVKLYTYSADADLDDGCMNLNQQCQITAAEARPAVPNFAPDFAASFIASMQYRILRDVSTVEINQRKILDNTYRIDVTANRTST